jgi:hypothetical protein
MTAYQFAKGLVLPAPVMGMNTEDPVAAMDPLYATWLCNVDAETQYCQMRGGYRIYGSIPLVAPDVWSIILSLGVYGVGSSQKLFAYVQGGSGGAGVNRVIDCSTAGTGTLAFSCVDNAADEAIWVNYKSRGSFLLEAFPIGSDWPTYNGASWANGWIGAGGGKYRIGASVWYKSRIYTAENGNGTVYYGAVGQITGDVTTSFPVGDVFTYDSNIKAMGTFSSTEGVISQEYIVFVNSYGEVLVYTGDYPGSSSWQIAAKFIIGEPLGYRTNSGFAYRNDFLIITKTGLFSCRQLMQQGNQAAIEQSISQKIDPYWKELFSYYPAISGSTIANSTGAYSETQRKVYVLAPGHIDSAGNYNSTDYTMFVYNTDNGAWNIHRVYGYSGWTYGNIVCYKGDIYFGASPDSGSTAYIIKLDNTVFTDEDITDPGEYLSYSPEIHSAYAVYGEQQAVTKLGSYQPIVEHDLPYFQINPHIDFELKRGAPTAPNAPAGVSKPNTSVGGEGTFFQYRFSGNTINGAETCLTGFKFYSMNATLQKGGPLS